jgi:uncharacterized RDD family membrane protein YckC
MNVTAHEILTPEHVRLRLVPAGLGARFWAWLVDQLLLLAATIIIQQVVVLFLPQGIAFSVTMTVYFAGSIAYMIHGETRCNGQTLGKRVAGIRVVDSRGLPLTVQQSFLRNIARVVDSVPLAYGFGALICLLDPLGRRGGDIIADTLVISEARPWAIQSRIAEARRFNSLRTPAVLQRVRHRVGLEERELLLSLCLRRERLPAQVRFDLMEEVGAYYREKLGIEDPHLSNENLVLDLTAILCSTDTLQRTASPSRQATR